MINCPDEIIELIASFLPTSWAVEKLYINKRFEKCLLKLATAKTIQELEKTILAKPHYPKNIKLKIIEEEKLRYKNGDTIDVNFCGNKIGYVKRRDLGTASYILKPFWCGYCQIPSNMVKDKYNIINNMFTIGFDQEITYDSYIDGNLIIGWDHSHYHNLSDEGYETLEATMDQVVYCYRLIMKNIKKNEIVIAY
jgi:hypothetical protein